MAFACAPADLEQTSSSDVPEVPAAPDRLQLERALSRAPANLRPRVLANGTSYVEVMRGFQHATIAVVGDGGVATHCVTHADEAIDLLVGKPR